MGIAERVGAKPIEAVKVRTRGRMFPRLLVLPAVLVLVAVGIFPLVYSLRASFLDWNLLSVAPPRFIGAHNYVQIFLHDAEARSSLEITLFFIGSVVLIQIPLALLLALLVNNLPKGAKLIATVLVIPMVLAPSVVAFQWVQVLNQQFGPLDYLLRLVRLPTPAWLANPHTALASLLITDLWEWLPLPFLIILGGLQSIPQRAIEAAQVDGSSKWQVFRYVKLPALKQFVAIALILRLIETFKNIGLVYIMTQGGPGTSTENLAYYTYRAGLVHFDIGYSSALAMIQLVIIIFLVRGILRYAESVRR